jgi:hypothetical protein
MFSFWVIKPDFFCYWAIKSEILNFQLKLIVLLVVSQRHSLYKDQIVIDLLTTDLSLSIINRSRSHGMAPSSSLSFSCTPPGVHLLVGDQLQCASLRIYHVVLETEIRKGLHCDLIDFKSARSACNFHVLRMRLHLLSV